jgi:hypothetical protein
MPDMAQRVLESDFVWLNANMRNARNMAHGCLLHSNIAVLSHEATKHPTPTFKTHFPTPESHVDSARRGTNFFMRFEFVFT